MRVYDFLKRTDTLISKSDSYDILSYILNIDYNAIKFVDKNLELSDIAESIIIRLENNEPPAYIISRREFCSNSFFINKNVLIPRFETEILVEKAVTLLPKENPTILDLCTGSGCILLSILNIVQEAKGLGVDISEEALDVAKINAEKFNLSNRAAFINGDVLSSSDYGMKFDMVACNPPYLAEEEYANVEPQVNYEPRLALIAKDFGLQFYKNILMNARNLCKVGGYIIFEIGYTQSRKLGEFAENLSFPFYFLKDYSKIDRVMVIQIS